MTREESKIETLKKIKTAKCGKEISEAIISHFRQFPPEGVPIRSEPSPYEVLSAPLINSMAF